jgi:hypothetical protein
MRCSQTPPGTLAIVFALQVRLARAPIVETCRQQIGVYTTFVQKLSLTYYTHNLRQQAGRVSLTYALELHRYFVEKAPYSFLDLITKTDWIFLH